MKVICISNTKDKAIEKSRNLTNRDLKLLVVGKTYFVEKEFRNSYAIRPENWNRLCYPKHLFEIEKDLS